MRLRLGWALPVLVAFLSLPQALGAAEVKKEVVKKKALMGAKYARPLHVDVHLLSEVPEVEPNNQPSQANLLGCGNVFRPASITPARDTDYVSFSANAGDMLTFGTDADGPNPVGDTKIEILSNDGRTVLGSDDDSGPGLYSLLTICAPYTGTYFGRIEAFSDQTGTYMAFLTCAPSSAPNDRCADAITIPCGPIALSGSTANACPDYPLPDGGCTGFAENGRDVVYKVNAFAGDSLYLDYVQDQADAAIFMVTDCSNPAGSCVAGSDTSLFGGHEVLSYKFTSPGAYYVVLSSFTPGSGGTWTASGSLTCAPDEIDSLTAHANIDLAGPWGAETVALNGPAVLASTVHALHVDFSGREAVPTELTSLALTGTSLNVGPVTLRLRPSTSSPFLRSLGEIAELSNATPGVLDLPPFTPTGSAYFQLSAYLQLEIPAVKLFLHNGSAAALTGIVGRMPAAVADTLTSPFNIALVDEGGTPSSYHMTSIHLTPYPVILAEDLTNPRMTLDLQGPLGLETVTLKGRTTVDVSLGNVGDTDGNGLEEVPLQIPSMNLSGISLLYGPVQAQLSVPAPHPIPGTSGVIEENENLQTAHLDVAPYTFGGTASSSVDLFFGLQVNGVPYHNHAAKHLAGTLTNLPPLPGETYRNFVATPLYGSNDNLAPYTARRMFFTPYDVVVDSTERDSFPTSRLIADVTGPWGFDQLAFTGKTGTEEYLGSVADRNANDRDEMSSALVQMSMTSPGGVLGHVPGPVTIQLGDSVSLGQIEELVNYTPGLLDVPPFTPVGGGAGFFDVFFKMDIPGHPELHNLQPAVVTDTVGHVPVGPGDTYRMSAGIPLLDPSGQPTGIVVTGLRLTPQTSGGIVGAPEPPALPTTLAIQDIRPNPAVGSATVTLALPRRASARLAAYDVNGRLVRMLWSGEMEAGVRTVTWDGRGDHGDLAPGGIYFLRFESENQRSVRRLAILR